jgi:hypothetical protein
MHITYEVEWTISKGLDEARHAPILGGLSLVVFGDLGDLLVSVDRLVAAC